MAKIREVLKIHWFSKVSGIGYSTLNRIVNNDAGSLTRLSQEDLEKLDKAYKEAQQLLKSLKKECEKYKHLNK